jgi:hypothetical protein
MLPLPMNRAHALMVTMVVATHSETGRAGDDGLLATLLPKLAASADRFEATLRKAAFTIEGHIETVGKDGATSDRRDGVFRVHPGAKRRHVEVVRYSEDGEDKTQDARDKVAGDEKKEPKEDAKLPFMTSEQPKYAFALKERDPSDPERVRIEFVPRRPSEKLFVGSAWVDARTGDLVTAGVSPSKTGVFVDYLDIRIEFAERIGSVAVASRFTFEGSGGFLFFHRKFRGWAKLSRYAVP